MKGAVKEKPRLLLAGVFELFDRYFTLISETSWIKALVIIANVEITVPCQFTGA